MILSGPSKGSPETRNFPRPRNNDLEGTQRSAIGEIKFGGLGKT